MSETFCPLPWIHLATRPNGDVRVCCTANASGAGTTDDKEVGLVKKDKIDITGQVAHGIFILPAKDGIN